MIGVAAGGGDRVRRVALAARGERAGITRFGAVVVALDRTAGAARRGARCDDARLRGGGPGALRPCPCGANRIVLGPTRACVAGWDLGGRRVLRAGRRGSRHGASRLAGVGGRPAREPARGSHRPRPGAGRWRGGGASCSTTTSAGSPTRRSGGTIGLRRTIASRSRDAGGCAWRCQMLRAWCTRRGPAAATSCSAVTRSGAGSPPPTRRGTSAVARGRPISTDWSSSTARAGRRRSARPTPGGRSPGSSTVRRSSPRPERGCRGSQACSARSVPRWPCGEPDAPSLLQAWPLLPASVKPPVPATNLAQLGHSVDTDTSPKTLAAGQAHLGGLAASGDPRGFQDGGYATAARAARAISGIAGADGTAWFHPRRLTLDAKAIAGGVAQPRADAARPERHTRRPSMCPSTRSRRRSYTARS